MAVLFLFSNAFELLLPTNSSSSDFSGVRVGGKGNLYVFFNGEILVLTICKCKNSVYRIDFIELIKHYLQDKVWKLQVGKRRVRHQVLPQHR